jgi:hypothetical protein
MKIALCFAALLVCVPIAASAQTASPQPLFITINANGAVAKSLEQYAPGEPVAVHVSTVHAADVRAITLIAMGPSGSPVRTPLARNADGTFGGNLALDETGGYTLTISERTGTLTTETQPITLDVNAAIPDESMPLALGGGALLFLGIGTFGFVVLRRRSVAPAQARAA